MIDGKSSIPLYSRECCAFKNVGLLPSIDQGPEKSESEGAENGPFPHTNEVACV